MTDPRVLVGGFGLAIERKKRFALARAPCFVCCSLVTATANSALITAQVEVQAAASGAFALVDQALVFFS